MLSSLIEFFVLASNLMPDLLPSASLSPDAVYGSTRKDLEIDSFSLPAPLSCFSSPPTETQEENSRKEGSEMKAKRKG